MLRLSITVSAPLAEVSEAYAQAAAAPRTPTWKMLVELTRSLVVAAVLAGVIARLGITNVTAALALGLLAWLAFPVVLLTGSVMWEDVPVKLAAIHAGDWLLKLLAISLIVSLWR